jgi:hypothetical protein
MLSRESPARVARPLLGLLHLLFALVNVRKALEAQDEAPRGEHQPDRLSASQYHLDRAGLGRTLVDVVGVHEVLEAEVVGGEACHVDLMGGHQA